MTSKNGMRHLSIQVPPSLYKALSQICLELEITKTELITNYIRHLQTQNITERKQLYAAKNLRVDAGNLR